MRRLILKKFRIVDETSEFFGSLIIENGIITNVIANDSPVNTDKFDMVIDGGAFGSSAVLMPSFIDLHAHFRDPGFPEKEILESASLAAVAGGYTTVVCMANTNPVTDTIEKARVLKTRSDTLGLVDLYPVLSLTKNMEGKELSEIKAASKEDLLAAGILMFSEDGKDVAGDEVFLGAMTEAKRLGGPISCHCDFGGPEAQAAKTAGLPRAEWSRIEENNAVRRAIELGKKTGGHIHIAHVSTKEAAEFIRETKKNLSANADFSLTCEAAPHHIGATKEDARRMGDESFGRVNPPLRTEADRQAVIAAIYDKTIDAIATDHAPHSEADKAAGAPGFSGLETAFSACFSNLAPGTSLQQLSALMSANPARILGLRDRGRIAAGLRADLVIVDIEAQQRVDPARFKSRGKCSPFAGKELQGTVLMTLNAGKIVFTGDSNV
ncbi:MAG: dihydroorotase [Treponema sp.]|nr:dihydroorotase [Treponema sp.]